MVVLGGPGQGETVTSGSTSGRMWVYNPQLELSKLEDSRPINKESESLDPLLTSRLDGHQLPLGPPSPLLVSSPFVT